MLNLLLASWLSIFHMFSINTGEIDKDIQIEVINTEKYPCMNPLNTLSPKEWIIKTEADYTLLKNHFGLKCNYPEVDFEKYSILGLYSRTENYCSLKYFHNLKSDNAQKKYIFTLTLNKIGNCKMENRGDWSWLIVPRLPQDYGVEFKTTVIQDQENK